jgi:cell division protein FtsI/penicillin-binding protein 2
MRRIQDTEPRARILTLLGVILIAYFVLLCRLVYWQAFRHSDLTRLAAAYHDDRVTLSAVRGRILDRNGGLLVSNTPVYSVFASPDLIGAPDRPVIAAKLAPILDLPAEDLVKALSTDRKFVYLKRRISAAMARDLDRLQLPGIGKLAENQRTYLDGGAAGSSLAANLLGFVNDAGKGNYGVEGFYDRVLAGTDGFEATIRDLANRPIVLSDRQRQEPVDGMTLQLSLDSSIQVLAERAIAEGLQKYQAESGAILIMEPRTGRIVAWADAPTYNANQFRSTSTADFVDPNVSHLYEPGSVMKVVTLSSALDTHAITPDYRFNETGVAYVGGYAIRNWDFKGHGMVTMTQVLQKSLNVGAIKAEQLEGPDKFFNYLDRFGLGKSTGIDLAGEVNHPLGDYAKWKPSELATATFGQGIDVTPIQMLAAINVVASGGDLVWPHVVDQMIDSKGVSRPVHARATRHVISPETAKQMQQMMVQVVEHGTGYAVKIDGFKDKIAGKTGTANVPENGNYNNDHVIASFVGFLPADHPQFTMLVIVRKPKILFEGAYVAAPIWKQLASAMITHWNIAP